MSISREPIMAALWGKLSGIPGLVTTSRRLAPLEAVKPVNMPALFLHQNREEVVQSTRQTPKYLIRCEVWIYLSNGNDPNAIPASLINQWIDAVDAALEPRPLAEVQTLNGLVSGYARIAGQIQYDEGLLDGISVINIPIEIETTK
jgi:hypothetical protein